MAKEYVNGFSVEVVGDLTGSGVWTLTPRDGLVHVRFDWTCSPIAGS
jgi:hypothetical protein